MEAQKQLRHLTLVCSGSNYPFPTTPSQPTPSLSAGAAKMQRQASLPQPVLYEPDALPIVSVAQQAPSTAAQGHQLLVVPVWEAASNTSGAEHLLTELPHLAQLDKATCGALAAAVKLHAFSGKKGETVAPVMLHKATGSGQKGQLVMLVGLGKPPAAAAWGDNGFHAAGTAIAGAAKSYKLKTIGVDVSDLGSDHGAAGPDCLTSLVAAALTGLYEGNVRYRSKPEPKAQLNTLQLLVAPHGQAAAVEAAARGVALAQGTLMARYLVEAPANVCTPRHLAAAAQHIRALNPDRFTLKVLEEGDCRKLGMGLFLGVAQGSDEPLRFIHLTYTPEGHVSHKVALVGKGLTFDSGGYNLKVQGGIETMKCDMGGAGAILGAARTLAQLQPAGVQVHFITAACENMVSGRATKPSDIHTAASGKTVEVNDTDAEGRLTLADALWYAQTHAGAQYVVDIATLTGAAGVALGQDTAALFANTDSLAAAVDDAGRKTGEKYWRMPLTESLKSKLESPIADLKNYAGRWGGAITAALFLQEFIDKDTQWCHLDVAGPAWNDATSLPTGFGAATLAQWVDSLAQQQQQPAAQS